MSIFSDILHDEIPQDRSCGIEIIKTRARIFFHNKQRLVLSASITNTHRKGRYNMKATGIVRRIDDLGRVVIPKEIRRTMRIREGDPLQMTLSPWEKFCFAMLDLSKRWRLDCT